MTGGTEERGGPARSGEDPMAHPTSVPEVPGDSLAWVTAEQMREIDRVMIEDLGITLVQMMENAGRNLAELIVRRYEPRSAVVLVGSGGNGGGGIVAARHLANRGVAPRIVLSRGPGHIGNIPRLQLGIARRLGIAIGTEPEPADVIVDALLGYSLEGDPRGRPAEFIGWANAEASPVCALDLPSGLDATTGRVGDPCVRADATMTLAMPKAGLHEAPGVVGELYLADISVPPSAYRSIGIDVPSPFTRGPLVRVR